MNRKKIKCQDGITLLEVMVAMIIMSFSLLLLLNMTMVALDGNKWSENTTITTQLLQEKLEQLRSVRNSNLQSGSDTAQGYVRTWVVSNAGSHLRQIDLEIDWLDFREEPHTNALTTVIRTDSV